MPVDEEPVFDEVVIPPTPDEVVIVMLVAVLAPVPDVAVPSSHAAVSAATSAVPKTPVAVRV